jgi:hypothetical protein
LVLAFPVLGHTHKTKDYGHKFALGLKRDHARHSKFKMATRHMDFTHLEMPVPGKADISAKVSPPEDQGNCGSCWVFSLTKALRSSLMVAGTDPGVLEFNYLLNNCGPGTKEAGCGGGDFPAADNFLSMAGPGLNKDNPYTQREGSCKGLPVAATAISYAMLGGSNGPTFKDLATAVGIHTLMVSIDVAAGSGSWMSYSSGIYNGCSGRARDIDHMIDLVGYDCETSVNPDGSCKFDANGNPVNGDGYLIVENNWGDSWGENGYMRTRFKENGQNCNAIATDALVFLVAQPSPTPTPTPVPPGPTPNGFPVWVWIVIVLLGLGVVGLVIALIAKK